MPVKKSSKKGGTKSSKKSSKKNISKSVKRSTSPKVETTNKTNSLLNKKNVLTGLSVAANVAAGVSLFSLNKKYQDSQKDLASCKNEEMYYKHELEKIQNKPSIITSLLKAKKDILNSTKETGEVKELFEKNKNLEEKLSIITQNFGKLTAALEERNTSIQKLNTELESCKKGIHGWRVNFENLQGHTRSLESEGRKKIEEYKKQIITLEDKIRMQSGGKKKTKK